MSKDDDLPMFDDARPMLSAIQLRENNRKLRAENERLRAALKTIAEPTNWSDEPGCLQWMGKRHAIEYAQSVLKDL